METMMTGKKIGKCGFYISRQHRRTSSLGHDNKQNNFFSCFPFSSFMLLWLLLLLKLLLDRQLWRKGGIAATCRWCCCLLFLLGFFFSRKKGRKVAARMSLRPIYKWPSSLSYSENEKSTSTFLGNGNIWLIFGVAFLISNKIQNLSSPHLFSFLLHVMRRCLKITQNVAFEFLNFGIFHQFLTY